MSLLLLSVITFMAVTFLVVSRSEKGAVTTSTDQAIARLAADAALERAKAELIAPIMAWTNPFISGLIVSTNYYNPYGFVSGNPSYTNVNYDLTANGQLLSEADRIQNIANLFYASRPPVYMTTGSGQARTTEFRYYLDLNRNGVFEPTGLVGETNQGRAVVGPGNLVLSNWYVGTLNGSAVRSGLTSHTRRAISS
jgi:hypothetical protein